MIDSITVWFILTLAEIPFFIIGLIGNVLVIRNVHKTRDMHTTINYLLANLAVGDVIAIFLMWPLFLILSISGLETFSCQILSITHLPILASSFTLTVLAVERYHALLKPFRTGLRLKEDNIKQAIAVIWISSFAICFPGFFLYEGSERYPCIPNKVHFIIIFIVVAYIPMMVFLYCYGSLINGLYLSHTICAENTNEEGNSEKKKLVITFILATAGFVVGYGPSAIFHTVTILGGDEQTGFKFSNLSSVVYVLILYSFRSTNFRESFKRIIFCREPLPQNDMQMS